MADVAVEAVVERTARENALPVVRNDEQEFPHERCYCCPLHHPIVDFSQDNAIEMRNIQE